MSPDATEQNSVTHTTAQPIKVKAAALDASSGTYKQLGAGAPAKVCHSMVTADTREQGQPTPPLVLKVQHTASSTSSSPSCPQTSGLHTMPRFHSTPYSVAF
jgi:hypothetical protein